METNKKFNLPPEHFRKLSKNIFEFKKFQNTSDKRIHLASLKFIPHSIFKIIENIPMPWENITYTNIIYHNSGAIAFINKTPKSIEKIFIARWGLTWTMMKKEKLERKNFKRVRIPTFDDEEKPISFYENLIDLHPLTSIKANHIPYISSKSLKWIYEDKLEEILKINNLRNTYNYKYYIKIKSLVTLFKASKEIIDVITDSNYYYLFNINCFKIAKLLNLIIPGGPKFEPPHSEFRLDSAKESDQLLTEHPIRVEYKIDYPYLYNNKIKYVPEKKKPESLLNNIDTPNEIHKIYYYNPLLYPIREFNQHLDFSKQFLMIPKTFSSLFSTLPYFNNFTSDALKLIKSPKPFNDRSIIKKRLIDINIERKWYLEHCPINFPRKVRISYQKLLKNYVLLKCKRNKSKKKSVSVVKVMALSKYFFQTTMDWIEIGIIICQQGHNMLNLMIHKRGLNFLHLDYNFNLKPIKTLTTKERKKSRFGNAFHICRELLRLTKLIIDLHIQFRLGNIDAYQLSDGVQYIFAHVGTLTGLYRYKYKIMKQIRQCKDLKHLIYYKFNSEKIGKGPGVGFWYPLWRVWIFFLRGIIPLLENWLGNLLLRQFQGRGTNKIAKNVTKQRIESHYDLELKALVIQEIIKIMPSVCNNSKIGMIMQHLSEAWRCWKANIPWVVVNMPEVIEHLILKYIKQKADWWTNIAHYNRERIKKGSTIDKTVCRKNLGRLTRLFLKSEQERQHQYLIKGPYLNAIDIISIYRIMNHWVDQHSFHTVQFPSYSYRFGSRLLTISLDNLKDQYSLNAKLNMEQKEELELLEYSYDNSGEILNLIKRNLLVQRSFKEVSFEFMDYLDHLIPTYSINCLEKLTDAFLDQYLWLDVEKTKIIPQWTKPSDDEIPPLLAYKWCKHISEKIKNIKNEKYLLFNTYLEDASVNFDLSFLNKIIKIFTDSNISDYLVAKNNIYINYKDMTHLNVYGIVRGLQFSTFLVTIINLITDLLIIGTKRAEEINKNFINHNFKDLSTFLIQQHPIMNYLRINEEIFILIKLDNKTKIKILDDYLNKNTIFPDVKEENENYSKDNEKKILNSFSNEDLVLIKAVFWEIRKKIPTKLCYFKWYNTNIIIINHLENDLNFNILGFAVKIRFNSIVHSTNILKSFSNWTLFTNNGDKKLMNTFIRVSSSSSKFFENRIRHLLMTSGTATFTKITNKWNTTLIGLVTYFREAISSSTNLMELIIKCEYQIQNRVKLGLNSKMPSRFPPVVFYSPKEIGGLGMVSMSHILIPLSDKRYTHNELLNSTHFLTGMSNDNSNMIPNILRYITPWETEFKESKMVWLEYSLKKQEALNKKKKMSIEDVESYWDKGIPRINTMFQKQRYLLAYDKGWRIRLLYKKYSILKYNPFWWTSQKHDGKLWNLLKYRTDVIQSLGGMHGMLEHTLFRGTYFPNWEGLFWEKSSGFEETMRFKKLTNAQRSGLNQIPNRRFTLWWSPTINRANIYIGFQVQLDLTGIFMHGKIPTLKVSLIQIFRSHLWQKIHESIVMDICQILDQQLDCLNIELVQKEIIHPKKSYKMNSSCADILLFSTTKWHCSNTSFISDTMDIFNFKTSSRYWLDIQLRWGDYDSHDIERYIKIKYSTYTTDFASIYPSPTGMMIGFDIAYNIYSAYGNWIPGLKIITNQALSKIIKTNPALYILRERIRKGLQLYSSESSEQNLSTSNYGEIFSNQTLWFVDDTNSYRVTIHRTAEGNFATKPLNGCLIIFNPKSGQLFLKILHSSVWDGQRRLSQYSKWRAAEEILTLIRSMPSHEYPNKIIVTRKALLDPLEVHLLDFAAISVVGCDLEMPFQTLLRLNSINNMILKANKSQLVILNLYDDWLTQISSYTAFSRLVLILRGLHINETKTNALLKLNSSKDLEKQFFWTKFDDDEWIKIEIVLKDLIIQDHCKRNKIEITSLTQLEIRDIILGTDLKLNQNYQSKVDHMNSVNKTINDNKSERSVISINKNNNIMISKVKNPMEKKEFLSSNKWRRSIDNKLSIKNAIKLIQLTSKHAPIGNIFTYVFSKNLLIQLYSTINIDKQIFCFLMGKRSLSLHNVFEIKILVFPPQISSSNSILIPKTLPVLPQTTHYNYLGWLHTYNRWDKILQNRNIRYHAKMLSIFQEWNGEICIFITLIITYSASYFKAYKLNSKGFELGLSDTNSKILENTQSFTSEVGITISNTYLGFSITPINNIWNYINFKKYYNSNIKYLTKIGIPLAYSDEFHNPFRFLEFYFNNPELNNYL